MKKIKSLALIISLLLILAVLGACSSKPKQPEGAVETAIAQTVAVQFTKTAIARPSDTPVPTATPMPTSAPVTIAPPTAAVNPVIGTPAVVTPAAGAAVGGTAAATNAPAAAPAGRDAGAWVSSDPKDGSSLPGGPAKITIKIMNTGTTTWTTEYGIAYVSGDTLGLPDTIKCPVTVAPQMIADFVLDAKIPAGGAKIRSDWKIVNANGDTIGSFYMEYN